MTSTVELGIRLIRSGKLLVLLMYLLYLGSWFLSHKRNPARKCICHRVIIFGRGDSMLCFVTVLQRFDC